MQNPMAHNALVTAGKIGTELSETFKEVQKADNVQDTATTFIKFLVEAGASPDPQLLLDNK